MRRGQTVPSQRPLQVAIDQRLVAYRAAGIARYSLELAAGLRAYTDVEVLEARSTRDPRAEGYAIRLRTPAHHRLETWALGVEMLMKARDVAVFHATDFVAPRLLRTPIVATVHDLAFARWPDALAPDALAYYRRIRRSRGWTRHWITPSRWTAGELANYLDLDPDCVTVVPHGVPAFVDSVAPASRDERGDFLLAVGTVEPRKRYDLLLDALSRIPAGPRLKVVGRGGWQSGGIERRLDEAPNVDWIRGVRDRQLRELYQGAIAVIVPSLAEGFGFAALEAMAVGTPVVSSGHGALPEVTGGHALVPASDDPEGWSTALERIVEDQPLWERLSTGGYQRSKQFSWRRAAGITAGVYREIAG